MLPQAARRSAYPFPFVGHLYWAKIGLKDINIIHKFLPKFYVLGLKLISLAVRNTTRGYEKVYLQPFHSVSHLYWGKIGLKHNIDIIHKFSLKFYVLGLKLISLALRNTTRGYEKFLLEFYVLGLKLILLALRNTTRGYEKLYATLPEVTRRYTHPFPFVAHLYWGKIGLKDNINIMQYSHPLHFVAHLYWAKIGLEDNINIIHFMQYFLRLGKDGLDSNSPFTCKGQNIYKDHYLGYTHRREVTSMSPLPERGQGTCTKTLNDGTTCDCKHFDKPKEVPYGEPMLCLECCHGKSQHDGIGVKKIFETMVGAHVIKSAKEEATKGFRTNRSGSVAPKKKKAAQVDDDEKAAVGNIVAVTYGLDSDGQLKQTRAPDMTAQQELEAKYGLAVTFGSGAGLHRFNLAWGPKKMNAFLREKLPGLFKILAKEDPWVLTIDDVDNNAENPPRFPYVLLSKKARTLSVVPDQVLTGARAYQNRGSLGVSPNVAYIWIASDIGKPINEAETDNAEDSDFAQVLNEDISDISDGNIAQEATRKQRHSKRLSLKKGKGKADIVVVSSDEEEVNVTATMTSDTTTWFDARDETHHESGPDESSQDNAPDSQAATKRSSTKRSSTRLFWDLDDNVEENPVAPLSPMPTAGPSKKAKLDPDTPVASTSRNLKSGVAYETCPIMQPQESQPLGFLGGDDFDDLEYLIQDRWIIKNTTKLFE
ncbi:uncharacterized protein LACBIDRAFT_328640 [Laccaria bicolor S238N-H82]|uniref:Predicted protein n=1 Tax=Laccaria bicolor (strain S238N-H82 / ATCC MYA-4686) TaxID=486041 RepID=B0DFI6_LACBS|nr:uncharacterized protein LACBIDRAFT_328640 [Laccaria bicolor S238N-H82]EDR06870.1 predicted protein [Laccaria bicolor S238N-H82]|eukprot:XP_001882717.1 predicted protein [Laccaria bicolor S238N-H82]